MCFQAGVDHIILAVSYRAELMEKELKSVEKQVSDTLYLVAMFVMVIIRDCLVEVLICTLYINGRFYYQCESSSLKASSGHYSADKKG